MNIFGNAKGVTIPANKTIYLNPKNTPTEKINNLIHELGHVQLHTNTNQPKTSLLIEELQANLISYFIVIVKNQLEPKRQSDILSGVTKAADNMIDFISEKVR